MSLLRDAGGARRVPRLEKRVGEPLQSSGAGRARERRDAFDVLGLEGLLEVTHGGREVAGQPAGLSEEVVDHRRRPAAAPRQELGAFAHRLDHATPQKRLAVPLQKTEDGPRVVGGEIVRERLGEVAAAGERPAVAPIEIARPFGTLFRPQLALQEIPEQRVVGIQLAAALQRRDEQVALHEPQKRRAGIPPLQDLGADVRIDDRRERRSEKDVARLRRLKGEHLLAEVVEDLRLGAHEDFVGQIGRAPAQSRGLAQELKRGHPSPGARVDAGDGLVLHRQSEGLEEQRASLLRREQKVVPLQDVHRHFAPESLEPRLGKGPPGQHEVERPGEIGDEPPQGPGAEVVAGKVLCVIEDDDQPAAERFLRVADENIGEAFRLVGGRPEAVPQPLAALAELGGVLLHPLDQVAEEHPRIPVGGIEPVPHRIAAEIAQEAGHEAGLAVAGSGDHERGAALQSGGEPAVQPGPRQVQGTGRRREELRSQERDGCHRGAPPQDHSSRPV